MSEERGAGARDDRPRIRVSSPFAREESGIELLYGSLEVFEVEHNACRDPIVGVDLNDVQGVDMELLSPLTAAPGAYVSEREVRSRGSQ